SCWRKHGKQRAYCMFPRMCVPTLKDARHPVPRQGDRLWRINCQQTRLTEQSALFAFTGLSRACQTCSKGDYRRSPSPLRVRELLARSCVQTGILMSIRPIISFSKTSTPKQGSVIVLATDGAKLSEAAKAADPSGVLGRAIEVAEFTGKLAGSVEVLAPHGFDLDRVAVVGVGKL